MTEAEWLASCWGRNDGTLHAEVKHVHRCDHADRNDHPPA